MNFLDDILAVGAGFAAGLAVTFVFMRQRQQLALARLEAAKDAELAAEAAENAVRESDTKARLAALEAQLGEERKSAGEKLRLLEEAREKLSDAFHALSAEALRQNNQSFLDLARTALEKFQEGARGDLDRRQQAIGEMVRPVRESLEKVDSKINELEKARAGAYESLTGQVRMLVDSQNLLRTETGNLSRALRSPNVRGRWGEMQLRRVVEMSGMLEHCDFETQETVPTEDGSQRPDLVVRLAGGKSIVVDAKAPLSAYLEAMEATDEGTRQLKLAAHAAQIRSHIEGLTKKA